MEDFHIHLCAGPSDTPAVFKQKTMDAEITGGNLFSISPASHRVYEGSDQCWRARLEHVLNFASGAPGFRPIFWIDPTEKDAEQQIQTCAASGIAGFKIICTHFYPREILPQLTLIAEIGLPAIFHSGILYDEHCSAQYNRPLEFECLMAVRNLRFSMAHIGWPWCDELVALFGKMNYLHGHDRNNWSCLYVDITPGTPPIYRREAIRKLYLSGYNAKNKVLWGVDNLANDYNVEYAKYWAKLDREIFAELERDRELFFCPGADRKGYETGLWRAAGEQNNVLFFAR